MDGFWKGNTGFPPPSPYFQQFKGKNNQGLLYKTSQQLPGGFQSRLGLRVPDGYLLLHPTATLREDTHHLQISDSAEMNSMLPKLIFLEDESLQYKHLVHTKSTAFSFPSIPDFPVSSQPLKSPTPPKYSSLCDKVSPIYFTVHTYRSNEPTEFS